MLKLENTLESDSKIAQIKKIHRQFEFGNASVENMQRLIGKKCKVINERYIITYEKSSQYMLNMH